MKQYDKIYVHCHSLQSNLEIVLEQGEAGNLKEYSHDNR